MHVNVIYVAVLHFVVVNNAVKKDVRLRISLFLILMVLKLVHYKNVRLNLLEKHMECKTTS
jgi:hypothetical protein